MNHTDAELSYLLARYDARRALFEEALAQIPDPPDGSCWVKFDDRTAAASEKLRQIEWEIMSMDMTTLERVQAQARVLRFRDQRLGSTEAARWFVSVLSGEYREPEGLIRGAEALALIEAEEAREHPEHVKPADELD